MPDPVDPCDEAEEYVEQKDWALDTWNSNPGNSRWIRVVKACSEYREIVFVAELLEEYAIAAANRIVIHDVVVKDRDLFFGHECAGKPNHEVLRT
jgi:hypothetical protein